MKKIILIFPIFFTLLFGGSSYSQTGEEISMDELFKPQIGVKFNPINFLIAPPNYPGKVQMNSPTVGITFQKLFQNRWLLEINDIKYINQEKYYFNAGINLGYDVFLFKKKIREKEKELKRPVKLKPYIEPLISINYYQQNFDYYDTYDTLLKKGSTKDTFYLPINPKIRTIGQLSIRLNILVGVQYHLSANWKLELSGGLKFAEYNISQDRLEGSPSVNSGILNGGFDLTDSQLKLGLLFIIPKKGM